MNNKVLDIVLEHLSPSVCKKGSIKIDMETLNDNRKSQIFFNF